jgi:hypothetical protein
MSLSLRNIYVSGQRLAALPALVALLLAAAPGAAQQPVVPAAPGVAPVAADPAVPAPQLAADDMKILDQGPIHEAFAEPVALDAAPRVVVDRQPPEPINELPPDVRPEGANVQWISGYWMYSDELQDFIWVSGLWRDVPPGRRWVPGHWTSDNGSFQWISGFWADDQVQEVQMLPHPPATLEVGPSSVAPAANYFWVPGCWIYGNVGYSWRAGYWYAGQPNWLWVPDHYCYTPRGSIFISGYWDYGLPYRGMLYAPVWWSRPVWNSAGWHYRPRSVVNTGLLLSALFIHSGHNHYYFGYGGWRSSSIRPWWDHGYRGHSHRYDPVFAYHRWHDGNNRGDWVDNVKRDFDHRQREYGQHRGSGGRPGGPSRDQLVTRAEDWARDRGRNGGLRQLSDAERQTVTRNLTTTADLRAARMKAERPGDGAPLARNDGDRPTGPRGDHRSPGTAAVARSNHEPAGQDRPGGAGQKAAEVQSRRRDGQANSARPAGEPIARSDAGNRGASSFGGDARAAFKLPPAERTTTRGPTAGVAAQAPRTQGSQRAYGSQPNWQGRSGGGAATTGPRNTSGPGATTGSGSVRRDFNPGATTGPSGQRAWSGIPSGAQTPSTRIVPSTSIDRGMSTRGGQPPSTRSSGSAFPQRSSGGSSFRSYPSIGGAPSSGPTTRSIGPSPSFRSSPSGGTPSFRANPSGATPSFRSSPGGSSSSFRSRPGGAPSSARSYSGSRGPSSSSIQSRGGGGASSFSRGGGGGAGGSPSANSGGNRGGGGRGRR